MAISNQECIKILNDKLSMLEELKKWNLEHDAIRSKYVFPSLEPEIEAYRRAIRALEKTSKTGRWERKGIRTNVLTPVVWRCSECLYNCPVINPHLKYNFCPNCGADMREETASDKTLEGNTERTDSN